MGRLPLVRPNRRLSPTALDTGTVGNFRLIAFSVNALA
jgi:hypothetical protein